MVQIATFVIGLSPACMDLSGDRAEFMHGEETRSVSFDPVLVVRPQEPASPPTGRCKGVVCEHPIFNMRISDDVASGVLGIGEKFETMCHVARSAL